MEVFQGVVGSWGATSSRWFQWLFQYYVAPSWGTFYIDPIWHKKKHPLYIFCYSSFSSDSDEFFSLHSVEFPQGGNLKPWISGEAAVSFQNPWGWDFYSTCTYANHVRSMEYIPTFTIKINQQVGKYTSPTYPMGIEVFGDSNFCATDSQIGDLSPA